MRHIIATGIDVTERKHLEIAILEVSAREQRRIGQDLQRRSWPAFDGHCFHE